MGLTGIPFIDNAMGVGPAQQAGAQQAQQNYAQGVSKDATQLAQAQQLYNWMQMMQRYQQYQATNPNPVQTWAPIQQAPQQQGQIGGGQIGSTGNPQQPQGMMPMRQGMQPGTPPQGQPQNLAAGYSTAANANTLAPGGMPLTYLQSLFAHANGGAK